ncbi:kinase-like domain, phloem protein 2-like protein [Tanacetum coccineum]
MRDEVVTCKLYLGLAFTILTIERVTIGCCEVGGGGGGGGVVVGGVDFVCGDGVGRGVGGVNCGVVYGFVYGVVKAPISAMIVRVPEKDKWCGTRGKFVRWKGVRIMSKEFAHLKVPLQNILSATSNFAEENVIRFSEFAKDYKGQLLWSDELTDITARRLNKERNDREQLFWMEISMLSSLKLKNLVSLVGFYDEKHEKIIIIRRETRYSLNDYLSDSMLLTWVRRLEICVRIAHALTYIHYDEPRDFSVIHRVITSGRVLLNDEWEPKLCDFERSMNIKASQRHHSFHTTVEGVDGYGDPTYIETKRVSHKSDIHYPLSRKKKLENIIDLELRKQMDLQSLTMFSEIAYECLDEEQSRRPNIEDIVPRLEKALESTRENSRTLQEIGEQVTDVSPATYVAGESALNDKIDPTWHQFS